MNVEGRCADYVRDTEIIAREDALRSWLTSGRERLLQKIDGLDIGWGGVQRWATARMPDLGKARHLDFACGVGTFLAQLGWRFPNGEFVGLNIDFAGPHAPIRSLLGRAGVRCDLVQADARHMPFDEGVFDSASCFLGLQDIEIGFGEEGVRQAVSQAARILRRNATLTLLDTFSITRFDRLLRKSSFRITDRAERKLGVKWSRTVAETAIALYATGWADQTRVSDPGERERIRVRAARRMRADMERQLASKGFFVPFGPVRMIVATKRT